MLLAERVAQTGRCASRPLSSGSASLTLNLQVYCMPAGCPSSQYTRSGHFCWSNALDSILGSSSEGDVVGGWTAEGCSSSIGGSFRSWPEAALDVFPTREAAEGLAMKQRAAQLSCSASSRQLIGNSCKRWTAAVLLSRRAHAPSLAAFLNIFDCLPKCFEQQDQNQSGAKKAATAKMTAAGRPRPTLTSKDGPTGAP